MNDNNPFPVLCSLCNRDISDDDVCFWPEGTPSDVCLRCARIIAADLHAWEGVVGTDVHDGSESEFATATLDSADAAGYPGTPRPYVPEFHDYTDGMDRDTLRALAAELDHALQGTGISVWATDSDRCDLAVSTPTGLYQLRRIRPNADAERRAADLLAGMEDMRED